MRLLNPRWLLVPAICLVAACSPAPATAPVVKTPPVALPPPPGAPLPPAAPAPPAANASGLPAELTAKIDKLIQLHKDYVAEAEKIQDPQAAKDNVQAMRQRTEESSALFEDILIASGKLSGSESAAFDAYMNANVTAIAGQMRSHMLRLEGLLQQAP
jgi:hypothetical protein